MSKKTITKPTESELEILQVLWENGPSTVRFVNDKLNEKKNVGYTTTLKMMQIMNEKGMLQRFKENRGHIYQPVFDEKETQSLLLDKILETAFGGSAMKLVMQTLGSHNPSKEEMDKIRNLLDKIERGEE
ncbi:MAG: transcriptional regulator [Ignavibacteria bacterium RBG_13_36_8]|nr:MAG: transcriptional regulator [Ignavibacteria bacterium RBG_13_36_8]